MRVALVHEWLTSVYGSERVFFALAGMFPQADLFAVVDSLPAADRAPLGGRRVHTTWIQDLPLGRTRFRAYLPWMPRAVEALDLTGYDLVISSSHAVAKGVLVGPDTLHVSYIHSPMRYAWDFGPRYLAGLPAPLRWLAARQLAALRDWDAVSAQRPHVLIANSTYIARRIRACWGRHADAVVAPPVMVADAMPGSGTGPFVAASRLVPYKRMDVLVEAFRQLPQERLVVVGEGPDAARCRRLAGANVRIAGRLPRAELVRHLGAAPAFLFAAEEDFGIAPVEALACGTPVIAYGRGGIRDSVQDGVTGLFFDEQTPDAVAAAVRRFRAGPGLDRTACAAAAQAFAPEHFAAGIRAAIQPRWEAFRAGFGRPAPPWEAP
jgi:glycosyltransferase involved in cell wall biosynthesis